jgi:hypothetical protein
MAAPFGPKRRIVKKEIVEELKRIRGFNTTMTATRRVSHIRLLLECGHTVTRQSCDAKKRNNENAYCEWCEEEAAGQ